jgi:hypothetical protein
VTAWMKQYAIAHAIASAKNPPDDLVAVPSSHPGDLVAALGAKSRVADPKTKQLFPPSRISLHLQVKPALEVSFPSRVVRVSIPSDLDMSDDWKRSCAKEPGYARFAILALDDLLRCLLRAQRHRQSKIAESTLENVDELVTWR